MAKAKKAKTGEEDKQASEPKLTDKQRVFCVEYAACLNATKAAIKAGYSVDSAQQMGSENLLKPVIRDEIERLINERLMPAYEVLERLAQQARGEQSRFFKTHRNQPYVDFEALIDSGLGHLLKKIKPNDHGVEVEFYDAQSALEKIGRHHKLFTDKSEVDLTNSDGSLKPPQGIMWIPFDGNSKSSNHS